MVMKRFIPAAVTASMFVVSGAFAQTPPTTPTPTTPPTMAPTAPSMRPDPVQTAPMLSEAEAKELIDAKVLSSDGKNLGEVAAIQRDSEGRVTELHADIGGFLGMGQTRVRVIPSQFTISDKQVRLTMTAEQVNVLPKIEK
jgi:hypothetical protein